MNQQRTFTEIEALTDNGDATNMDEFYDKLQEQLFTLIDKPMSDQHVLDELLQTNVKERTNK